VSEDGDEEDRENASRRLNGSAMPLNACVVSRSPPRSGKRSTKGCRPITS